MSNLLIPNLFDNIFTTAELSKLDENFQVVADNVNANFSSVTANLSSLNTRIATLNAVEATQSLTGNGYQKLPGGLIIQWGTHTTTQFGNSEIAVIDTNFPTPFPTACFSMTATPFNSTISADGDTGILFNRTAFGIKRRNDSGRTLTWIAIGY